MTILMKPIEEILDRIVELETWADPESDEYLDEGMQSELNALYWVLETIPEDEEQALQNRIAEAREKQRQELL